MKIIKIEIYSPENKLLREIPFNENGLSIIYGDVEQPKNDNETSNSIGKTVLLKMINVVFGSKNSGKDTIPGLKDYILKAKIIYNDIKYDIEITIGNSKNYYINNEKMSLTKYKEKFNINRSLYGKQTNLDKRKGLISTIAKNPNKDDISTILKILYLDGIQEVFKKIKKMQEKIELISKYNTNFKDNIDSLNKEAFSYEMKKKQVDDEIKSLNERISKLKISKDLGDISKRRVELDKIVKNKNEKLKINNIRINKYEEMLNDSQNNELSLNEVKRIYEVANVEIPSMIKRELKEIEDFYDSLLKDKNEIYISQIAELKLQNKELLDEINKDSQELDSLSKIIADNDLFTEAINIYDNKTKEKIEIDTKLSEINGKLTQINNSKEIKNEIDSSYVDLNDQFDIYKTKIDSYREFIFNLVEKIYGSGRNPYLTINPSDGSYKYKALPVKIDLSIDGDSGEGISATKYLLFDYLIMNYNNDIDFLIEDSACFEGIDRRQIRNILLEGVNISNKNNKQYIVSLNKYLINDLSEFEKYIVVKLSERDTLLNIKF